MERAEKDMMQCSLGLGPTYIVHGRRGCSKLSKNLVAVLKNKSISHKQAWKVKKMTHGHGLQVED